MINQSWSWVGIQYQFHTHSHWEIAFNPMFPDAWMQGAGRAMLSLTAAGNYPGLPFLNTRWVLVIWGTPWQVVTISPISAPSHTTMWKFSSLSKNISQWIRSQVQARIIWNGLHLPRSIPRQGHTHDHLFWDKVQSTTPSLCFHCLSTYYASTQHYHKSQLCQPALTAHLFFHPKSST